MKTVMVIYEDNHGVVGIATNYLSAIKFLIEREWIHNKVELIQDDYTIATIEQNLGKAWQSTIKEWNRKEFNDYFDGLFYIGERELFEAD